jgi:hypothetical protein
VDVRKPLAKQVGKFVGVLAIGVAGSVIASYLYAGLRGPKLQKLFFSPSASVVSVRGQSLVPAEATDKGALSGACANVDGVVVVFDQDVLGQARQRWIVGAAPCEHGQWTIPKTTIVLVGISEIYVRAISKSEVRLLTVFGGRTGGDNRWPDPDLPGDALAHCTLSGTNGDTCPAQ